MSRSTLLWIAAFLLTAAVALFQRMTGPSYPVSGSSMLGDQPVPYRFLTTYDSGEGAPVQVTADDTGIEGVLRWRRFRTNDAWTDVVMRRDGTMLSAELPTQPPAGKVEYTVVLRKGDGRMTLPPDRKVVLRYKGAVPLTVLIPHILAMFLAMLLSTRTGLETFAPDPRLRVLTLWTIGLLALGGLLLGPVLQWYAFGALWTGWPLGTDLTDNKTAVALIGWVTALVMLGRAKQPSRWVLGAAVLLLVVYLIPHSVLGSELDYDAGQR